MTEVELWRLRENQAAYWEHKARGLLDDADHALHIAYQWRRGDHDNELTKDQP